MSFSRRFDALFGLSVTAFAPPCLADSHTEEHTHCCCCCHGERAPEGDANGSLDYPRTADRRPEPAEHRKRDKGRGRDDESDLCGRHERRDDKRDDRPDSEGRRRDQSRLDGMRGHSFRDAQLVTRMGAKGVFCSQLDRNLSGETIIEPARNIDARQLLELCRWRFF